MIKNSTLNKRADNGAAAKRRTRSKKTRVERILILVVFAMAIIIVYVNIFLLSTSTIGESDNHHSVSNTHREMISRGHSVVVLSSRLDNEAHNHGDNSKKSTEQAAAAAAAAAEQGSNNIEKNEYTVDEKLMRILRHVGIQNVGQLSEEDRCNLPTWDEVVDRVGNDGPKILGLETCKTFQAKVPKEKRKLAVSGPFNSGTHYLNELLINNCLYTNPNVKRTKGNNNPGVLDQVPWGKHQSPRFRLLHNTALGASIEKKHDAKKNENGGELDHPKLPSDLEEANLSVLPVVMVRDPFTWWQSMCKTRYSAHWFHIVPYHCPNFIANHVEKEWFHKKRPEIGKFYDRDPRKVWKVDNVMDKANYTLDKEVIPLWVRYHSENRQHKSLAHMWMDWYKDYYDADYPRLMIRLEDLVYYPHETLRQVCECANGGSGSTDTDGGYFEYIGDENLVLSLDSAIRGTGKGVDNMHGQDRTGLLGAMAKHAGPHSVSHRTTGMTPEDLEFATTVLKDSETFSYFGYKIPPQSALEQSQQ